MSTNAALQPCRRAQVHGTSTVSSLALLALALVAAPSGFRALGSSYEQNISGEAAGSARAGGSKTASAQHTISALGSQMNAAVGGATVRFATASAEAALKAGDADRVVTLKPGRTLYENVSVDASRGPIDIERYPTEDFAKIADFVTSRAQNRELVVRKGEDVLVADLLTEIDALSRLSTKTQRHARLPEPARTYRDDLFDRVLDLRLLSVGDFEETRWVLDDTKPALQWLEFDLERADVASATERVTNLRERFEAAAEMWTSEMPEVPAIFSAQSQSADLGEALAGLRTPRSRLARYSEVSEALESYHWDRPKASRLSEKRVATLVGDLRRALARRDHDVADFVGDVVRRFDVIEEPGWHERLYNPQPPAGMRGENRLTDGPARRLIGYVLSNRLGWSSVDESVLAGIDAPDLVARAKALALSPAP